jgi:hypothetical protein
MYIYLLLCKKVRYSQEYQCINVAPPMPLLLSMGGHWPPDDDADTATCLSLVPPGLILCASQLSTSGRMTAHGGAGSSDQIIVHLGEVGSSSVTAACAFGKVQARNGYRHGSNEGDTHHTRGDE